MSSRQHKFTRLLAVLGVAVIAAGAYLSFELGRYQAGYSLLDERRRVEQFEAELAEREARIEALERESAILETSREIDRETYARVESELDRLQQRIQAQEEELAFYRGIVTPEDGVSGLRIQSLEIGAGDSERHHTLRLTLVQAIVHNERVSGSVRLGFGGRLDGEAVELGYDEVAAGAGDPGLGYDFRYFQTLERELALPVGFEPDTVTVEVRPRQPRGEPITKEFGWEAAGD